MSPEEMKDEIEAHNKKYNELEKKKDDIIEKTGENVFRRKIDAYKRKMFKLNKEMAWKVLKLEQASIGDFKKPESTNLGQ